MQNIVQFIIVALLLYIGYLAKFYLPNYFKKKAENLAQSQDIEKLTNLVKEVEFKFEERTQLLKAKIELTNQLHLGLHNEERNALVVLHNRMYDFYSFLTDVSLGDIDFKDDESLQKRMSLRNIQSDIFFHSKNNAMLFILDKENSKEIEDLMIEIFLDLSDFSKYFVNYIGDLRKLNITYKSGSQREFLEKQSKLHEDYLKKIFELVDNTGPKLTIATKAIKKCLEKRISQEKQGIA